jgi:hypothetical protein
VPVPQSWTDVLRAPAFVINLDSRPDRLASSTGGLRHAGFSDVRRFSAIDAAAPGILDQAWGRLGAPQFDSRDEWFRLNAGAQGCLLSHIGVWQEIIDQSLPFACVFEDDIFFHRHWRHLAPTYFNFTPTGYDLLYMGSRIVEVGTGLVQRVPVYCTHAYLIPREGAIRMRSVMLEDPTGVGTIDIKFSRHQFLEFDGEGTCPFNWYVWNGLTFPEQRALYHPTRKLGNSGLVFQDHELASSISG